MSSVFSEDRTVGTDEARVLSLPPAHRLNMSTQNGVHTLDAIPPTFDPGLDVMTEVFSHVQCVKTRHSLALVSKLWMDASKPAAAYPDRFDFDAFPNMPSRTRTNHVKEMMDNDEALSLPYERVVGLLGEAAEHVCNNAASLGSVRLLKWARENNRAWSVSTCTLAALNGHLPALKYLHENGCPWDVRTCTSAAENGHLPALKYLHENGCPWDRPTCTYTAANGHLPALKYLHENGCPWDVRTCWYAAAKGHLPILKYLHENGCPWDHNTCWYAAHRKHWDCFQYAVDNKCTDWEYYAKIHVKHLR